MLIKTFKYDRHEKHRTGFHKRLIAHGASAVTDAELIGIVIGSDDLARQILNACHNNLHELGKLSITDLQRFHGIGEAKAAAIAAVIEIGRRRSLSISGAARKYHPAATHTIRLVHFFLIATTKNSGC